MPRTPLALIANGQEWLLRSIESILGPKGYGILRAYDGRQALEQARRARPDVLLLDSSLPNIDGYEVCRALRGEPEIGPGTPILLTATSPWSHTERLAALRAGAWDVLSLPLDAEQLVLRLAVLVEAKMHSDSSREVGLVDEITGLYNLRGVFRRVTELAGEAERQQRGLTCIVLAPDLDPSSQGDPDANVAPVVQELARLFRGAVRVYDTLGRVGLAEFVVVSPSTSREGAERIAQRLADIAETAAIEGGGPRLVRAGCYSVEDLSKAGVAPVDMLTRATTALRLSQGGPPEDRIRFYNGSSSLPTTTESS